MKKLLLPAALAATVVATMYGCKKDTTTPVNTDNYTSLRTAWSAQAPASKSFTVDAASGGSFYGTSCRYVFPANAFRTLAGASVTGSVTVEVQEMLKPSDMIFSRILPVSNGQQLISGGEVSVNASQNGQKLLLKDYSTMQIQIPQFGNGGTGMGFFVSQMGTDSATNNAANWVQLDTTSGVGTVVYNGDTVTVFTDSTGLCNADRFMNNPSYQTFTVSVTGVTAVSTTETWAYALYDNYNAVWPLTYSANDTFQENHVPNIPVHFVVATIINGNFYAGISSSSVTPATGSNYVVNLIQTTPAALKVLIDAL